MPDLVIDERIRADGAHTRVTLATEDGARARLFDDGVAIGGALPAVAIARVMERYGRPLEVAPALADTPALALAGGQLHRWRHHAPVDAEARDYLIWVAPGGEPIAVLATMATAAIRHLALNFAPRASDS